MMVEADVKEDKSSLMISESKKRACPFASPHTNAKVDGTDDNIEPGACTVVK